MGDILYNFLIFGIYIEYHPFFIQKFLQGPYWCNKK